MTIRYVDDVKADRMQAVADALDDGTGTAVIQIYTAPRPAAPGDAPTGATLLVEHDLNTPCGTVTDGDLELDLAADSTVVADGVPNWARFVSRNGDVVCDGTVGQPGSGADVEIGASQLYSGGKLAPTSAYLRDG